MFIFLQSLLKVLQISTFLIIFSNSVFGQEKPLWNNLSAGYSHTVAIKSDSTMWGWGYSANGQLAEGTSKSLFHSSPVQMGKNNRWTSVSAGVEHTIATAQDSSLWGCGASGWGQLGNYGNAKPPGGATNSKNLIQMDKSNWINIATGSAFTLAIKADSTLWGCGYNGSGAISHKTKETAIGQLIQIGTDHNWAKIAARGRHCIALKSVGTLWTWGKYSNEDSAGTLTPMKINHSTSWVNIAAGNDHYIALDSNGTLWAWGNNASGQIGNGTYSNVLKPTQIGLDSNWSNIAAGNSFSYAVKSDGTLWSWGNNDYAQLGTGSIKQENAPVHSGIDENWKSVTCGGKFAIALKHCKQMYCGSGVNEEGQLGNNSTFNNLTFNCSSIVTSIYELSTIDKIDIYPNPACNIVAIKTTSAGTYSIMNVYGQVIQTFTIKDNFFNSISVENLSSGLYTIVNAENKTVRQKIIINKDQH